MEHTAINKRTPIPKPRRPAKAIPIAVRIAADAYKKAYKSAYGMEPRLKYDRAGGWIRVAGQAAGVSVARLRELTAQLVNRTG